MFTTYIRYAKCDEHLLQKQNHVTSNGNIYNCFK